MAKSRPPQPPAESETNIQVVCPEPIIVPRDAEPAEQTPLPSDDAWGPRLFLVGGTLAVLLFLWWQYPAQTQALWQSFIGQMFRQA